MSGSKVGVVGVVAAMNKNMTMIMIVSVEGYHVGKPKQGALD